MAAAIRNSMQEARTSLHYAGLLAYLDQNADLLAEICVAMAYAGETAPGPWTNWLARETHRFEVTWGDHVSVQDDYHAFFVCHWHHSLTEGEIFGAAVTHGRMRFDYPISRTAPLREMSECMFRMEDSRSGDWIRMRGRMEAELSAEAMRVVSQIEEDSLFPAFFHDFARVEQIGVRA